MNGTGCSEHTRLYNNNRKGSRVTCRDTTRVTIRDSEQSRQDIYIKTQ